MKSSIFLAILALSLGACASKKEQPKKELLPKVSTPTLTKVAEFNGVQVTGVTVSDEGRVFANFPRWRDGVPFSVVEIAQNGTVTPYPNEAWNNWKGRPEKNKFTCAQAVVANGNSLFVLDPSSPKMEGVVGHAMLYEFDLTTDTLRHEWKLDDKVAPKKSYLNDLRIEKNLNKVFITDSGLGAIIELDMTTGKAVRLLDRDPSTESENITLKVNDRPYLMKGQSPRIHADGIAYNDKDKMLYYHALTSKTLYRVPASEITPAAVENMGQTPAPDGMIFDKKGNLYMADLEKNAIVYRTPSGELKTLIKDDRIGWADSFALDNNNNLLFTDSKLGEAPVGAPVEGKTFTIYKVPLPI